MRITPMVTGTKSIDTLEKTLPPTEFFLIDSLRRNGTCTKAELLKCCNDGAGESTLFTHISNLRNKGVKIKTIRGYGYSLLFRPQDSVSGDVARSVLNLLEVGETSAAVIMRQVWPASGRIGRSYLRKVVYRLQESGAIIVFPSRSDVIEFKGWREVS